MNESISTPTFEVTSETSTEVLLKTILVNTRVNGTVFTFVCPRGESEPILNRVRMMLSRKRKKMDSQNLPFKHFRLNAKVTKLMSPRVEMVQCWQSQSSQSRINEAVDDLIIAAIQRLAGE